MTFVNEFLECGAIIQVEDQQFLIGYGKRTFMNQRIPNCVQFFAPDYFFKEPNPWFIHENYLKINGLELKQQLQEIFLQEKRSNFNFTISHKKIFEDSFCALKKQFIQNKLIKAVPYIFESSRLKMSRNTLINSLINLLDRTTNYPLHVYGFWDVSAGMLGITPELLFSQHENIPNTIKTMACAGTQSNQETTSLLENPKLRHEHAIVIEDITHQLQPFGKLTIGKTEVKVLPGLSHLITPMEVSLKKERQFEEFVRALHPTSALGAFPRKEGWDWLLKYQSVINRRRFGAPFGYVDSSNKQSKCVVAIRNVQWDSNGMHIGAGCGVTAESVFEQEWNEICLKILSVKAMLKLEDN